MSKFFAFLFALVMAAAATYGLKPDIVESLHWPVIKPDAPVVVSTPVRDAFERCRVGMAKEHRDIAAKLRSKEISTAKAWQDALTKARQTTSHNEFQPVDSKMRDYLGGDFSTDGAAIATDKMAAEYER